MTSSDQVWKVSPHSYVKDPGKWAHLEFQAWAETAERHGYFKPRQAPHIVRMFDTALRTESPLKTLKSISKKTASKGLITDSNRLKISQTAARILHQKSTMDRYRSAEGSSTAAAPSEQTHGPRFDFVGQIPASTLAEIKTKTPKLYRFFTDPSFAPDPKTDYDLDIENTYGVLWIGPQDGGEDRTFIERLRNKYASDFDRIERNISDPRNRFIPDDCTRLANNNIASLFDDARREPLIRDVLRDALAYLLSKHAH